MTLDWTTSVSSSIKSISGSKSSQTWPPFGVAFRGVYMKLTRSQDWPLKLREYLEAQNDKPFAWATNDCCTNACGWIKLSTGIDVYTEFTGTYTDETSAHTAIQQITGKGSSVENAAEYITAQHTMGEIRPVFASRGDIVLFDGTLGAMLGIVGTNPVYSCFPGDAGLRRIRTTSARRAWRVG